VDGTVMIHTAEGVFHDVSPEKMARVEYYKLKN